MNSFTTGEIQRRSGDLADKFGSVRRLRASALAHLDRHAEALELIEKNSGGLVADDSLTALIQVCRAAPGQEPAVSESPAARALARLLKALAAADRLLAGGDPEGSAAVLEDPAIQALLERQSAAR